MRLEGEEGTFLSRPYVDPDCPCLFLFEYESVTNRAKKEVPVSISVVHWADALRHR